jgi:hypothetical protein
MANDNRPDDRADKLMKYLRYAVGEIALVVIFREIYVGQSFNPNLNKKR